MSHGRCTSYGSICWLQGEQQPGPLNLDLVPEWSTIATTQKLCEHMPSYAVGKQGVSLFSFLVKPHAVPWKGPEILFLDPEGELELLGFVNRHDVDDSEVHLLPLGSQVLPSMRSIQNELFPQYSTSMVYLRDLPERALLIVTACLQIRSPTELTPAYMFDLLVPRLQSSVPVAPGSHLSRN